MPTETDRKGLKKLARQHRRPRTGFLKVTALAAVTAALVLLSIATVSASERSLVELHKNAGKMSNKECLACHGQIVKQVPLNTKFKMFHRVHLESKLATPKNCSGCHQSVDVRNGSAAALRKQVDPQLCAGCHSGGMEGAKVLFAQ
jgi:predicted CXXCH cytochrome family protein